MSKPTSKTDAKPKTKAIDEAVYEYCDRQLAHGIEPTYKMVTDHFGSSNFTVTPFMKAWQESRITTDRWEIAEATKAVLDDAQEMMWSAVCRLAQSKLYCETHDLKRELREANASLIAYQEANRDLTSALDAEKIRTKEAAEESIELASQVHVTQQKLHIAEAAEKELTSLRGRVQSLEQELQKSALQVAKLEGKIEVMSADRGSS